MSDTESKKSVDLIGLTGMYYSSSSVSSPALDA